MREFKTIYAREYPFELPSNALPNDILKAAKKTLAALQNDVLSDPEKLDIAPYEQGLPWEGGVRFDCFKASIADISVRDSGKLIPASVLGANDVDAAKNLIKLLLESPGRVLVVGGVDYKVVTVAEEPSGAAAYRQHTPRSQNSGQPLPA